MKRLPIILMTLLAAAIPAAAETLVQPTTFWEDGEPEVLLGAYFDEMGTDSLWEGEIPDTLTVHLVMWNGGLRDEGFVRALEYAVELPAGFEVLREDLPDYGAMAMGEAVKGVGQVIRNKPGDGLLISTLVLRKVEEIAYDSRIRVIPHPVSKYLRYVFGKGAPENVDMRLMEGGTALLNAKLGGMEWKPTRSR